MANKSKFYDAPEKEVEICDLYKSEQYTYKTIGDLYEISEWTVRNIILKHGLSPRPTSFKTKAGRDSRKAYLEKRVLEGTVPSFKGGSLSDEARARLSEMNSGSKNAAWKGGRSVGQNGYIYILSPDHPSVAGKKNRYIGEHRLVMEKHLGRILSSNENVHHKNGIKNDNRIENLEIVLRNAHMGSVTCPHCGQDFKIK